MAVSPEAPYAIGSAIYFAGGIAKRKGWPAEMSRPAIAAIALLLVASATRGTGAEPVTRAIGWLFLIAAVSATATIILPKSASAGLSRNTGVGGK